MHELDDCVASLDVCRISTAGAVVLARGVRAAPLFLVQWCTTRRAGAQSVRRVTGARSQPPGPGRPWRTCRILVYGPL